MEFVIRTIRTLFFSLDRVIYGLIDDVYGLMLQLARTSVFSQETINTFSKRIYTLIGLFMLFKISVSLINYVLNPDDFGDKERGFNQIIKRVILSLVMIVLMPYIFTEAYELQAIVLEENTIMNVIFGAPPAPSGTPIASQVYTETAGQKIQFTIMYAFAQPNYEEYTGDSDYDLIDCTQAYETDSNGNYRFRELKQSDVSVNLNRTTSDFIYQLAESCWGIYDPTQDIYKDGDCKEPSHEGYQCGALYGLFESRGLGYLYQQYAQGVAQQNFNMFFNKDVILAREDVKGKEKEDNRYFIDYKMGISTAVGVAVLYLFLIFCIDIAIRSVKLGFLQMIAPIPILSYCDPKSSKDGMFQRWVKMCTTTYLDLFFRLAALYFGIYVISLVGTFRDVTTGKTVSGWMVSVFMIVGILIFVKKLPDIIKDVFNIKGDGKFTLNPIKRLEDEAFGGKAIKRGLGVGMGLGAAGVVGASVLAGTHSPRGALRGAGKAIAGGFRGDKFGKLFSNSYSEGRKRGEQIQGLHASGVTLGDEISSAMGQGRKVEYANQAMQSIQDQYKQYEGVATKADAFAKEFAKQEAAATQRGDRAMANAFAELKEKRIQEIAKKGGKVGASEEAASEASRIAGEVLGMKGDTTKLGEVKDTYGDAISKHLSDGGSEATLTRISSSMQHTAERANSRYGSVDGFSPVTGDVVEMNKKAGAVQSAVTAQNSGVISVDQSQGRSYGGKAHK